MTNFNNNIVVDSIQQIKLNNINIMLFKNTYNALNIAFDKKPDQNVLTALKANKFKYFKPLKAWSTFKFKDDMNALKKFIMDLFVIECDLKKEDVETVFNTPAAVQMIASPVIENHFKINTLEEYLNCFRYINGVYTLIDDSLNNDIIHFEIESDFKKQINLYVDNTNFSKKISNSLMFDLYGIDYEKCMTDAAYRKTAFKNISLDTRPLSKTLFDCKQNIYNLYFDLLKDKKPDDEIVLAVYAKIDSTKSKNFYVCNTSCTDSNFQAGYQLFYKSELDAANKIMKKSQINDIVKTHLLIKCDIDLINIIKNLNKAF